MPSINSVHIMGHAGRDAEVRYSADGKPVANLTIACSEKFKSGNEWKEKTEWVRVVAFGVMAEQAQHVKKGALVDVVGKLQTRSWGKDDEKRYVTEVVANVLVTCNWHKGEEKKPASTPALDAMDEETIPF